ncbi:MAG: ankyrin repeat domain-containing protein [Patescibacteria group bacterium]|jgi:ankyrin repeat protein/L-ascorbate metabolism protein UlaG (beta-lactamase superfamily)|nr:ankyrin repeat domain-containing protein [Patescibacteria group bacterium]
MTTFPKILLTLILFAFSCYIYAQDIFKSIKDSEYEKVKQFIHEDPNLVDSIIKWDCTPLIYASYWGKDTIVEFLLKSGADMYKAGLTNGRTPLHLAAMQNNLTVVEVFLNHSIDVNVTDFENKTALIYAIENNKKEMIDLLLKANAKLPEEQELINPCLHSAVLNSLQDIADKLLENGASLSGFDNNGRSLLHNAVIGKNLKWTDLLIAKNIQINKLDSFNRTPLHYSVELNQLNITKLLIQNGAEINSIDCTNRTPLNIAQALGYIQIAAFLESKGGVLSEPEIIKISGDGNKQSEIKVTYIANMGVLISSASKTILIDGLFDESYYNYSTTPENIVNKMNNFEPPFNSLDLILITHSDGDHFSAPMLGEYLSNNKTVKVVCNNLTSAAIMECDSFNTDSTNIVRIAPELYQSTDTIVNDIKLKILRLRHDGRDGQAENIGFLVDMDGFKIFHSGDSDGFVKQGLAVSGIQEYDSIGINEMNIDLAIVNRGYLWNSKSPGIQIIEKHMKPKHIIMAHFSENNKQGEWERVDQTIKEYKDILPEITVFKWQMQEIILQKEQ